MKFFILLALVVAFTLQNANAIDTVFVQSSLGVRNFMILWYRQFKKDNNSSRIYSDYAQIDSVLLGSLDKSQATELDTFKNLYGDCKDILSNMPENKKNLPRSGKNVRPGLKRQTDGSLQLGSFAGRNE